MEDDIQSEPGQWMEILTDEERTAIAEAEAAGDMRGCLAAEIIMMKAFARERGDKNNASALKYFCVEEFVLKHGYEFTFQPLPSQYRKYHGMPTNCFNNAFRLAMAFDELTYVEGYGLLGDTGQTALHAWCSDAEGNVIDPTWSGLAEELGGGAFYFGIPFKKDVVELIVREMGQSGVLTQTGLMNSILSGEYKDWTDWILPWPPR